MTHDNASYIALAASIGAGPKANATDWDARGRVIALSDVTYAQWVVVDAAVVTHLPDGTAVLNPSVPITRVLAKADASRVREFADDLRDGKIELPISKPMPLSTVARGHALMEKGGAGKLVLKARRYRPEDSCQIRRNGRSTRAILARVDSGISDEHQDEL